MADKKEAEETKKPEEKTSDTTTKASLEPKVKKKTERPKPSKGKMRVKVYSPYQVYFNEEAKSISAINETGPFDILPQHHKFLTLLTPCELLISADKGEEKIKISRGIMYVKEDNVTVFLDV